MEIIGSTNNQFDPLYPGGLGQPNIILKTYQASVGTDNVSTGPADRVTWAGDTGVLEKVIPAVGVRPMNREALGPVVRPGHKERPPLSLPWQEPI
jgi:hypothetical protein